MEITISKYISNPSGSRSRMVGEEIIARQTYENKYNNLMLRVAGNIDYYLAKTTDGREYYLYAKIPSESIEKLTYDVVLMFYTLDDVNVKSPKLDNYFVKFFSNDPNFLYTYAYTFNQNNLIIGDLSNKIERIFFSEKPKNTNPNQTLNYVKSFYFAYILYKNAGLDFKYMWSKADRYDRNILRSKIMTSEEKRKQLQSLQKLQEGIKNKTVKITGKESLSSLEFKAKAYDNLKKSVKSHTALRTKNSNRVATVKRTKYVNRHK